MSLKIFLPGLVILLAFTSCATVFNGKTVHTTVRTSAPARIVVAQDTMQTVDNMVRITLERSDKPVAITAIGSDSTQTVVLKPRNSFAYISNLYFNAGIGGLIERHNPKRFGYKRQLFIPVDAAAIAINAKEAKKERSDWFLQLSIPYVNNFVNHPDGQPSKQNTGFWGFSAGVGYYYKPKKFMQLQFVTTSDFSVPVPAPVDYEGEHEFLYASYVALSDNYELGRFTLGYGLSFGTNTWERRNYDKSTPIGAPQPLPEVKETKASFGLVFPAYFRIGKYFQAGILYRPTFYSPNADKKFGYDHALSLDLAWKFFLTKKHRND